MARRGPRVSARRMLSEHCHACLWTATEIAPHSLSRLLRAFELHIGHQRHAFATTQSGRRQPFGGLPVKTAS